MQMVGAVCDFCEAWVCHSRRCIQSHACKCVLQESTCIECNRSVFNHGGLVFNCASCDGLLCEDDQLEHQGTCQQLDTEDYKCLSCNKFGEYSCLKCRICFCANHIRKKGRVYKKDDPLVCTRCNNPGAEELAGSSYYGRSAGGYYGGMGDEGGGGGWGGGDEFSTPFSGEAWGAYGADTYGGNDEYYYNEQDDDGGVGDGDGEGEEDEPADPAA